MRVGIFLATLFVSGSALAHSWYPKECCDDRDCAPVISKVLLENGDYEVTTKIGKALLPKNFKAFGASEDNAEHACMMPTYMTDQWEEATPSNYNYSLICYFVPGVF